MIAPSRIPGGVDAMVGTARSGGIVTRCRYGRCPFPTVEVAVLIVSGWLRVPVESRDAYLAGCLPVVEAARRAEGCLDFSLSADLIEADRINVYERWESDDVLSRFREGGPSEEQATQILSAEVRKYRISGIEAP
jgi:quinol monooxygenase YgiN